MISLRPLSRLTVCSRASWTCLNVVAPRLTNCTLALPRTPAIVRTTLHRNASTNSSARVDCKRYIGQSGRHYSVEKVLQEETSPVRRVYLATQVNLVAPRFYWPAYSSLSASNQKFILKYVHEVNFEDLQDINNRLRGSAKHVRLVNDTISENSMFVFQYFADHLLSLAQKDLPLAVTKQILKDALRGIAELHDQDIVHTGNWHSLVKQWLVTYLRQISNRTMFWSTGKSIKMGYLSSEFSLGILKMRHISLLDQIWSENRPVTGCGGALKHTPEDRWISRLISSLSPLW